MWLSTISILFMIVTKTLPTLAYPPQVVSADRLPTLLHGHIDIGDTVHLRPESERTDAEFVNHMRPVGRVRLEAHFHYRRIAKTRNRLKIAVINKPYNVTPKLCDLHCG